MYITFIVAVILSIHLIINLRNLILGEVKLINRGAFNIKIGEVILFDEDAKRFSLLVLVGDISILFAILAYPVLGIRLGVVSAILCGLGIVLWLIAFLSGFRKVR